MTVRGSTGDAPPGYAGPTTQTAIGVPSGYTPGGLAGGGYTKNPNPYADGAEWDPQNNPYGIATLQYQLVSAGLLNPDNVRPGLWDQESASAYRSVLGFANSFGGTATDALNILLQNPSLGAMTQKGRGGGGGSTRTIQLTDPTSLQEVANQVAPTVIGRKFTDDELARFVSSFHGAESGLQNPDPQARAASFAREAAPTEASARSLADVYDSFLKIMSGAQAQANQVPG